MVPLPFRPRLFRPSDGPRRPGIRPTLLVTPLAASHLRGPPLPQAGERIERSDPPKPRDDRREEKSMTRSSRDAIRLMVALTFFGSLLTASDAWAQEKQKYSFEAPPGVQKYTQQHAIDVGDVLGHQVRIYELQTKYTAEAPAYDGVKVVEVWTRGASDYTNGSGHFHTYAVNLMANGDKIFSHTEGLTHTVVNADGSRKSRF